MVEGAAGAVVMTASMSGQTAFSLGLDHVTDNRASGKVWSNLYAMNSTLSWIVLQPGCKSCRDCLPAEAHKVDAIPWCGHYTSLTTIST